MSKELSAREKVLVIVAFNMGRKYSHAVGVGDLNTLLEFENPEAIYSKCLKEVENYD